MKVLWLSRHDMTPLQVRALANTLDVEDVEVVKVNMTFPARSFDAIKDIFKVASANGVQHVAGVFPAHIAARLALYPGRTGPRIMIPVSVPVHAEDGASRGFEFSHWERF